MVPDGDGLHPTNPAAEQIRSLAEFTKSCGGEFKTVTGFSENDDRLQAYIVCPDTHNSDADNCDDGEIIYDENFDQQCAFSHRSID